MHSLLITIMFYLQNYNDLEWIFNKEMFWVFGLFYLPKIILF